MNWSKFGSRKFLTTVAAALAVVAGVLVGDVPGVVGGIAIAGLAAMYVGVEGYLDRLALAIPHVERVIERVPDSVVDRLPDVVQEPVEQAREWLDDNDTAVLLAEAYELQADVIEDDDPDEAEHLRGVARELREGIDEQRIS